MAEIDEGNAMLNKLINQCLLEGGETSRGDPCVKMHDLVRDMVLQIDGLHSQYLAVCGNELKILSHVTLSKALLKIHISNCYSLNLSPMCPRLTTIILHGHFLANIPKSFFQHLKALKILNLSGCRSSQVFPDSISNLVNLVGLLLRDCSELRYVPTLARLTDLRSVYLSFTSMRDEPRGLEKLINVRYLNLISSPMKMFQAGIIPKLSYVRYLVCSTFTKVSVSELMCLKNLEMFKGAFHDIHDLCVYVKHREQNKSRLTSYTFFVGFTPQYLSFPIASYWDNSLNKIVTLINCNLGKPLAKNYMYLLPKDVQMLVIAHVPDLTSLCALASWNYATNLQICEIKNCSGVKELVSTSSSSSFVLQSLQRLKLEHLESLEALIGRKKKPCNAFYCLQVLDIYGCPRIKVVFNIGLLSNLNNLEELTVRWCNELEEIIGEPLNDDHDLNEGTISIVLPKLRHIRLFDLPYLRSICPASRLWFCQSLPEIEANNCPKLEQLSLHTLSDKIGQASPLVLSSRN